MQIVLSMGIENNDSYQPESTDRNESKETEYILSFGQVIVLKGNIYRGLHYIILDPGTEEQEVSITAAAITFEENPRGKDEIAIAMPGSYSTNDIARILDITFSKEEIQEAYEQLVLKFPESGRERMSEMIRKMLDEGQSRTRVIHFSQKR